MPTPLAGVRFGVIDDARRRQRRRWLGWIAVGLVAVVALVLTLDRPARDQPAPPGPPVHFVPPSRVLARAPYVGVSCSIPNSTRCDDLGLAVWLKRPAVAVNAEMARRRFSLDDRQWSGPVRHHRRRMFAGFLRGAGLGQTFRLPPSWEGQPARSAVVRVRIDYGRGVVVETRVRVSLSPGWG
jgi:hypothetical protein